MVGIRSPSQVSARRSSLGTAKFFTSYISNADLAKQMAHIVEQCGGIARIVNWGVSGKGQNLLAIELYAGDASDNDRPGFK